MFRRIIPFWLCVLLSTVGATRGADEGIPATRLTKTYWSKFFLRFSPDGSRIAYSRHYPNRRASGQILMGLRIVGANGNDDRQLLPQKYDAEVQIQEHPSWSPDGKQMLLTGGGNDTANANKDVFICDVDDEFRADNLRKIIPGRGTNLGEIPCWSPDGKQFVATTVNRTLWIFDPDGKNKTSVIQVAGRYCHQAAWSPDGEWIAFASDRDGNCELYKIRYDGTDLTRLTKMPGIDCRPRWSPDAQWILFTSNRSGNNDLYLMRADGADVRNLTVHPAVDDHAAWAPNGQSITFVSMRDGGFDIYRMPIPGDITVKDTPPEPIRSRDVVTGDLVAHYDFNEARSGVIRDKAGRNHLRLKGAKRRGNAYQGRLSFDGKEGYAVCGNTSGLRISEALTVSLWVRPAPSQRNGYVLSKYGWNIYFGSDGIPRFETRTAANSAWDTLAATTAVPPDRWSHLAVTFDPAAKTLNVYINGHLAGTKPRTDGALGAVGTHGLALGHYVASKSQQFAGEIDELRIYRRALTATEIAAHATQQPAESESK